MIGANRPAKGSSIWIEPIRRGEDIHNISSFLADNPRDRALFELGVNTGLNARDLLRIRIGQVRWLLPGEFLTILESKSGKPRSFVINSAVREAIRNYLESVRSLNDEDYLFKSQKGGGILGMSYLNRRVKSWCRKAHVEGNFGGQTLRKTFGYLKYTRGEMDLDMLMAVYGHFNRKQTADYLGIRAWRTDTGKRGCSMGRSDFPIMKGGSGLLASIPARQLRETVHMPENMRCNQQ